MIGISKWQLICFASLIKFGLLFDTFDVKHIKTDEGYLDGNTLQAAEQESLEEFFWTGSGDGPPFYKPKDSSKHGPHQTVVHKATIYVATIYLDGSQEDPDPLCISDCDKQPDESGVVESIDQIPSADRRYWLLTVVAGLFFPQDFPILEEKLAKLYRTAFLRQQAHHLGIVNGQSQTLNDEGRRRKRSANNNVVLTPTRTFDGSSIEVKTRRFEINKNVYRHQMDRMKRQRNTVKRELTATPDKTQQRLPYEIVFKNDDRNKSKRIKQTPRSMQKVQVKILNVTHGTDAKDFVGEGNSLDSPNDVMGSNQTEIIYYVVVSGKPVLATAAAADMELVATHEAIAVIGSGVVLKAEPYVKEPQATPLIPSQRNGTRVTAYVNDNLFIIMLMSIALILLILLLITLLLYGRSKRRLAAETKRQSATQALVQKINVDDDINTIRSNSMDSVGGGGVDNLAFEKEQKEKQKKGPPVLHFPLPPVNRPSSSTSTTSDSSIYYPKRKQRFSSIQDLMDERRDGKTRNEDEDEEDQDEIYTKVSKRSGKTTMTNLKKDAKAQRQRKKYRLENNNKVSSLEQEVEVHSPASYQSEINEESLMPYREHNEAFNLNVATHYHNNMLLTDKTFTVIDVERNKKSAKAKSKKAATPTEAINSELIQQHAGARIASADSNNSMGSFLSMASIRSFPKCKVPEPLSRVLEPVSVTHLDHSDADYDTLKNYRMMDSQKSLELNDDDEVGRVHSDGADPGVVGPVVWEMHKKGLDVSTSSLGSPLRDPHATRNRYEGLLEGAMKLYGSSSYSNCHSLMNQQEDELSPMPGSIKAKEMRGKSAATIRLTSRTSGLLSRTDFNTARPMTAGPDTESSQNPVPTIRAWTSSSSNSNLVRPLSAGVYHKPEAATNKTEIDRSRAMSASPIIDAIQKELRRISGDEK